MYDNVFSLIVSTTSVLAVAAIADREGGSVMVMDIEGAFLDAYITGTAIKVHMRLNKVLTSMLVFYILCREDDVPRKGIKPECLAAIAFLTTRIHCFDIDDLAKLKWLLGYLQASQQRGIVLRLGDNMIARDYADASYGVHQSSGKSHTGCDIVIGDAEMIASRSSKQNIATKSSIEAELVGLYDSVAQAIHLRNFITQQGYIDEPVVVYQDNLSCMALIKRIGPGLERSRHINIRHFFGVEREATGDVAVKHLGTELVFANALTKSDQGA
jgi:hypothetical protein